MNKSVVAIGTAIIAIGAAVIVKGVKNKSIVSKDSVKKVAETVKNYVEKEKENYEMKKAAETEVVKEVIGLGKDAAKGTINIVSGVYKEAKHLVKVPFTVAKRCISDASETKSNLVKAGVIIMVSGVSCGTGLIVSGKVTGI